MEWLWLLLLLRRKTRRTVKTTGTWWIHHHQCRVESAIVVAGAAWRKIIVIVIVWRRILLLQSKFFERNARSSEGWRWWNVCGWHCIFIYFFSCKKTLEEDIGSERESENFRKVSILKARKCTIQDRDKNHNRKASKKKLFWKALFRKTLFNEITRRGDEEIFELGVFSRV